MTTPDERSPGSPPPDPNLPVLDGMNPDWQFVYDRLREGHAAAVIHEMAHPGDAQAAALLRASRAAVRAFRQEYQRAATAGIVAQIEGME